MFNYEPEDSRISAAFGVEGSYDTIGPAWGTDKDDGLRMSEAIISGPSSDVCQCNHPNQRLTNPLRITFAVRDR
jgi:hypothetical protein